MEIPPTTNLLNLVNALPVQSASAAPSVAKGSQPAPASSQPPTASDERQPPSGRTAHRGSIVNILA